MKEYRPWTVGEAIYLAENAHRKPPKKLAEELGRSKCSVRSFAYRRRLITRDARRNLLRFYTSLLEQGVWVSPRVVDRGRLVDLDADFESFMTWSIWNGYHPKGKIVFNTSRGAWTWIR